MNKEINFFLFGDIRPEKRKCFFACLKEVKDIVKPELFKFNAFSIINKVSEVILPCISNNEEEEKDDENKIETPVLVSTTKEIVDSKKIDIKIKDRVIKEDDDQVLKSINELNNEIEINSKYEGKVKEKYEKYSELNH